MGVSLAVKTFTACRVPYRASISHDLRQQTAGDASSIQTGHSSAIQKNYRNDPDKQAAE